MSDAIECEHLPILVGYDDELQSGRDPNDDDEHADELPWDGFWQFVWRSWAGVVTRGQRLWMYWQNLWNAFGDGLW